MKIKKLKKKTAKLQRQIENLQGEIVIIKDMNKRIAKRAEAGETLAKANAAIMREVMRQTEVHMDQIASLKDSIRKLRR